jgi:hypothetical protein
VKSTQRKRRNGERILSIECQRGYIEFAAALCAGRRKTPIEFRPLHDRVVISRAEGELESKGRIIVPGSAEAMIADMPVKEPAAVNGCIAGMEY